MARLLFAIIQMYIFSHKRNKFTYILFIFTVAKNPLV